MVDLDFDTEGCCRICGCHIMGRQREIHIKWHERVPEIVEDN